MFSFNVSLRNDKVDVCYVSKLRMQSQTINQAF